MRESGNRKRRDEPVFQNNFQTFQERRELFVFAGYKASATDDITYVCCSSARLLIRRGAKKGEDVRGFGCSLPFFLSALLQLSRCLCSRRPLTHPPICYRTQRTYETPDFFVVGVVSARETKVACSPPLLLLYFQWTKFYPFAKFRIKGRSFLYWAAQKNRANSVINIAQ